MNGSSRSIAIKKNIIASLFLKSISILVSLQVVPLTINYINPTRYGIWLTLSSIVAWLSYFDLGFAHGFRNRFAEAVAKGDMQLAREYVSTTYVVLSLLFSGVFFGCGLALIYMRGSSTGGTDFLTMSIKALHPHLSLGAVTMTIDLVIILIGWPVFGNLDAVLYGLISTFVTSTVIDKIMYGTSAGKLAIIITTQGPAMATHIDEVCARGSTLIRARGSYTTTDRQVLLCACSKAEAYKVRRAAHQTDPDAFVMITETSEVFGEGFIDPTDNVKIQ